MINVIDENQFKFTDGYQVLYFYGVDIPFNKKMFSILLNLEKRYGFIEFNVIDVFTLKKFIRRFNLIDVPTTCLFYNSKEIFRVRGIVLASSLKSMFYNILKDK